LVTHSAGKKAFVFFDTNNAHDCTQHFVLCRCCLGLRRFQKFLQLANRGTEKCGLAASASSPSESPRTERRKNGEIDSTAPANGVRRLLRVVNGVDNFALIRDIPRPPLEITEPKLRSRNLVQPRITLYKCSGTSNNLGANNSRQSLLLSHAFQRLISFGSPKSGGIMNAAERAPTILTDPERLLDDSES